MPIELNQKTYATASATHADQSLQAQAELNSLKLHIQPRANASKFPGYLRLVKSEDGQAPLTMERSRWFSRRGTARSEERQAAADYVKNLFRAAYGHRCTAQQYDKLMGSLEGYLDSTDGKMGSRHFLDYLKQFDEASHSNSILGKGERPLPDAYPVDAGNAEKLTVLARSNDEEDEGDGALPKAQAMQVRANGIAELLGVDEAKVKLLSANTVEGEVYAAGSTQVYKHLKIPVPISHHNLRKGEMAAAWLHDTPSVVTPTDYIVQRNDQTIYRVPASQFKAFVRDQIGVPVAGYRNPNPVRLKLLGTVMPLAAGKSLEQFTEERGTMPSGHFKVLARGVVQGLQELGARRAVIHDIKPANVMFDPLRGEARLIDLGGLDKLSKHANTDPEVRQYKDAALNQTRNYAGTDFTMSPRLVPNGMDGERRGYLLAAPHGPEVDRYSGAITLLSALAPKISSQAMATSLGSQPIPEDTPADQYLTILRERLQAIDPAAAQALNARFQQEPALEALIHDCLLASEPGQAGEAAWQQVLSSPVLVPEHPLQQQGSQVELSTAQVTFANGVQLPREGLVRAGQHVRQQGEAILQGELKGLNRGPLAAEGQVDPRFKQFQLDVPRAQYQLGPVTLNDGSQASLDRGLESLLPGADRHVARDNARLELAHLLNQNTSLTLHFQTDLNPTPGSNASAQAQAEKKPWYSAMFDHPDFRVQPDPQNPGAMLIDMEQVKKTSSMLIQGRRITSAEGDPEMTERMHAQLRYTPSPQAGQAGRVEVLDIRFAYQVESGG